MIDAEKNTEQQITLRWLCRILTHQNFNSFYVTSEFHAMCCFLRLKDSSMQFQDSDQFLKCINALAWKKKPDSAFPEMNKHYQAKRELFAFFSFVTVFVMFKNNEKTDNFF